MSVDIQKQLDLRPYSDKNVVSKPAMQTQNATQQPLDEEKSNAAKWMVGLTATAAIVIGGLYAAKHGKLGEKAEKFAKKLFGEGVNEIKNKTTEAASTITENAAPTLAFVTPALIRGKIKNPKIKLNDFVQELEKANLPFRKIEVTSPKPKTSIKLASGEGVEPWSFRFDKDGVLSSIRKQLADGKNTVYRFKDEVLTTVEHKFSKTFSHIIELDPSGKLERQVYKIELQNGSKLDFEPPKLTRSLPAKEKTERTKTELLAKISQHVSQEEAAAYAKLLEDDASTGTAEIIQNVIKYNSKFKTYQLNKPEHITTAVKTIKNCTAKEFLSLLKEVAPAKFAKIDADKFGKTDLLSEIHSLTNRSAINENTKILDILQDL